MKIKTYPNHSWLLKIVKLKTFLTQISRIRFLVQVESEAIVSPTAEFQATALLVEREVCHVDGAFAFYYDRTEPHVFTGIGQNHSGIQSVKVPTECDVRVSTGKKKAIINSGSC